MFMLLRGRLIGWRRFGRAALHYGIFLLDRERAAKFLGDGGGAHAVAKSLSDVKECKIKSAFSEAVLLCVQTPIGSGEKYV